MKTPSSINKLRIVSFEITEICISQYFRAHLVYGQSFSCFSTAISYAKVTKQQVPFVSIPLKIVSINVISVCKFACPYRWRSNRDVMQREVQRAIDCNRAIFNCGVGESRAVAQNRVCMCACVCVRPSNGRTGIIMSWQLRK